MNSDFLPEKERKTAIPSPQYNRSVSGEEPYLSYIRLRFLFVKGEAVLARYREIARFSPLSHMPYKEVFVAFTLQIFPQDNRICKCFSTSCVDTIIFSFS